MFLMKVSQMLKDEEFAALYSFVEWCRLKADEYEADKLELVNKDGPISKLYEQKRTAFLIVAEELERKLIGDTSL